MCERRKLKLVRRDFSPAVNIENLMKQVLTIATMKKSEAKAEQGKK
jgi:hypothetical protein